MLQGSIGVPLGVGGVLRLGMYLLESNWWVPPGAGEYKGSHPAWPVCHTTVVLHRSYTAAVHMPSIGIYRVSIGVLGDNLTLGFVSYILSLCMFWLSVCM